MTSGTATAGELARPQLELVAERPLRIADVAVWYGDRSGGIRTYLDAKQQWAAGRADVDHRLVVPRTGERHALTIAVANGYRLPLGPRALERRLLSLKPELIVAHDPFWSLLAAFGAAERLDVPVVAVAHASAGLEAAGLPGPAALYSAPLAHWRRRAHARVDAVLTAAGAIDGARNVLPLRFGVDPCFRPQPCEVGEHVLYAGRLSREKGMCDLIRAAASEHWPLRIVGDGPLRGHLERLATRLGMAGRVSFAPFLSNRAELAREYSRASCVVLPGRFETFGLTALEAAACGASVVTSETTPAAAHAPEAIGTFRASEPCSMRTAIERARRRRPSRDAAMSIARRNSWNAAFEAETQALRRLLA